MKKADEAKNVKENISKIAKEKETSCVGIRPGVLHGDNFLPWAKCQIFLEVLFMCNKRILNKNFHT